MTLNLVIGRFLWLVMAAVIALAMTGCGADVGAESNEAGASNAAEPDEGAVADADGGAVGQTPAAEPEGAAPASAPGGMPAECQLPPVEVLVRKGGAEMEPVTIQGGVADIRNEGISVFMQFTDFPLDPALSVFDQVEAPPPGGVVLGVGISHVTGSGFDPADFEPISTGDHGIVSATQPDLLVWADVFVDGEGLVSTGVTGTAEVLWLDDEIVCMDVNITSESGGSSLVGVVAAPVGSVF